MPLPKRHIEPTFHAAERAAALWNCDFVEATARMDRCYMEGVKEAPGRNGSWWYKHPDAWLNVQPGAPPVVLTVCPPEWVLLKDLHGGDWYWLFQNSERLRR